MLPSYRNKSIDLHSTANQLTGFCMRATLAFKGFRLIFQSLEISHQLLVANQLTDFCMNLTL